MNPTFFVKRNRWALKLFAAKSPWVVQAFMFPLIFFWSYVLIHKTSTPALPILFLYLGAGFFYWTFVEYLIHRFYFHWRPKNETLRDIVESFHIYHHHTPSDLQVINSGWLTAYLGSGFHFGVLWLLTGGHAPAAGWILIGTMLTYVIYEWVHYLVHRKKFERGLMLYLQEFHLTHHMQATKNFGQISPIWDFVFGTHTPPQPVDSNPFMQRFIHQFCKKNEGLS